jgi:hypothetical protein
VPGFICPDRPASEAYIPINGKHALVAKWPDRQIAPEDVAKLNREAWKQARELVFGHREDVIAFMPTATRSLADVRE